MSKTWLDNNQRRPLDMNFDIKSFRTQVKDRIKPCCNLDSGMSNSKFSSQKKETFQSVPSFENLQARIRDFSYSRLGNIVNQKSHTSANAQYSPFKVQGLQQKISDSIGPKNQLGRAYQTQSPTKPTSSFSSNIYGGGTRLFEGNRGRTGKRSLADQVQLNEIVALRNKIESSYVSRSTLTSTYVSELIKLAQAITSSLKQD